MLGFGSRVAYSSYSLSSICLIALASSLFLITTAESSSFICFFHLVGSLLESTFITVLYNLNSSGTLSLFLTKSLGALFLMLTVLVPLDTFLIYIFCIVSNSYRLILC